jgi:hypothetical protein
VGARNRKWFFSSFILFFDPSPGQPNYAVGLSGQGLIVGYYYYSEVMLLVQGSQDFQDFLAGGLIQVSGGFVGQKEFGLDDQSPGYGGPLHLPPR